MMELRDRAGRDGGVLDINVRVDGEGYRSSFLSVSFFLMKSGARPSMGVRRAEEVGRFPERCY